MGCVYRGSLCSGLPHCPFVYRSTLELIMGDIEHQIEFESTIERERMADLEVIQRVDRGLSGQAETAYIMDKFEELRRMKYGFDTNS